LDFVGSIFFFRKNLSIACEDKSASLKQTK